MSKDVVITSAVRTAIGTFQGSLKDHTPGKMGSLVVAEVLKRAGIEGAAIDQVVFGSVVHTEPRDMYVSRVSAIEGGIPATTPCLTLNRLCGSGLQAIVTASQQILLGDADVALAGGVESMSRASHATNILRVGQKMGDIKLVDMMIGALNDPFGAGHMGVTAENVAKQWGISRDQQDAFAAESQRRALAAIAAGHFKSQILPVMVKKGRDEVAFDTDEHPKAGTTVESLAGLRPAFMKDGTVTAGNASGINDGASALVLMSADRAKSDGAKPIARVVGYALAGVEPSIMGIGPIDAVRNLLKRTGLKITDFDVIESNEAFAAQACAVSKDLELDPAKTNPNGGAIALGHPIGASGAIIATKTIYELQRTGGRYGLATMCIGGGQGIAVAFERM